MTFCVPDESASCGESEDGDIDAVNSLRTDAFIRRCLNNFDRPNCGH